MTVFAHIFHGQRLCGIFCTRPSRVPLQGSASTRTTRVTPSRTLHQILMQYEHRIDAGCTVDAVPCRGTRLGGAEATSCRAVE